MTSASIDREWNTSFLDCLISQDGAIARMMAVDRQVTVPDSHGKQFNRSFLSSVRHHGRVFEAGTVGETYCIGGNAELCEITRQAFIKLLGVKPHARLLDLDELGPEDVEGALHRLMADLLVWRDRGARALKWKHSGEEKLGLAGAASKAVMAEVPYPGDFGPLTSCNFLSTSGDLAVHWGFVNAASNFQFNTSSSPPALTRISLESKAAWTNGLA